MFSGNFIKKDIDDDDDGGGGGGGGGAMWRGRYLKSLLRRSNFETHMQKISILCNVPLFSPFHILNLFIFYIKSGNCICLYKIFCIQ
jgi:hypothetical protein